MNYMEKVAEMLGLKLEDEFYLKGHCEKYKITKRGVYYFDEERQSWFTDFSLVKILNGDYEIIKNPILTESERAYLSAIIKPWREKVTSIIKELAIEESYISIKLCEGERVDLPNFEDGVMYKGMKAEKEYTLEDLEL